MQVWQADFYRRPVQDETGQPLWELVVCEAGGTWVGAAFCPQSAAKPTWLTHQLQQFAAQRSGDSPDQIQLPDHIQVFRPQSVSLLQAACQPLQIQVEPTRRTPALKQWLQQRAEHYRTLPNYTGQPYEPIALEKPPPLPLPENLWGEQWRFAAIAAVDLPRFQHRPIPILEIPEVRLPLNLQLASTQPIPGVVIDAGRRSMPLSQWLKQAKPYALQAIPGDPDGLILEAGLVERWVLTTFTDPDVVAAARTFQARQQAAKGLHFLLVQPDDSGMTFTGFWLLQAGD